MSLSVCQLMVAKEGEGGCFGRCVTGDTHSKTGGPARLPAQVAGRWGNIYLNSVRWGKKYFVLGCPEQLRQDKKSLLYRHKWTHEPTKEGPLSFVLFESPFTSFNSTLRVQSWSHDVCWERWLDCQSGTLPARVLSISSSLQDQIQQVTCTSAYFLNFVQIIGV